MTSTSIRTLATCACLALSVATPPVVQARDKPEVSYFLSKTDVAVSVTMTLVSCPSEAGELPEIDTNWTVLAAGAPDPAGLIKVDVSSGFLAKRSNAFEFYQNGTLAGFNGSSEGQGGAIIDSILKTVSTIAPFLGSGPSRSVNILGSTPAAIPTADKLYCSAEARGLLDLFDATKGDIRSLENKVLLNTATLAELDLLERRRKKRLALVEALTFEAGVKFVRQDSHSSWIGKVELPKLLGEWFSPNALAAGAVAFDKTKIPGLTGFGVTINPSDYAVASKLKEGGVAPSNSAGRLLVYRQPALADVNVTDLNCNSPQKCIEPLQLDSPLLIGQWGAIRSLPVGNAGLFGSRQASASFDQFGTPLKLSYGSDSGATEIGSTIEAAGTAATAITDSETTALERKVKREELRQKLLDLRTDE